MTSLKTPWHLWLVGILSLLWNFGGASEFTAISIQYGDAMSDYNYAQQEYFTGLLLWVQISWGIAAWSAFIGSVLLLLRIRLAVTMFLINIFALILTTIHRFVLDDEKLYRAVFSNAIWFSVSILVLAILLYLYAHALRTKGVLR